MAAESGIEAIHKHLPTRDAPRKKAVLGGLAEPPSQDAFIRHYTEAHPTHSTSHGHPILRVPEMAKV